jgi:hypothetical protein
MTPGRLATAGPGSYPEGDLTSPVVDLGPFTD